MATSPMDPNNAMHGRYRLIAELGQGGSANVYLAVARGPSGFNKLVVLKLLKVGLSGEAEYHQMFLNEARLAARLNHPNVVQTNEVFEEDGRPIIVMEYLEGVPFSKLVPRAREVGRSLPLPMHLRIICEALSGLHYCHELKDYDGTPLGVVHRDMNPQNIFVSFDGRISLLDFGIAKLTSSHGETQTGVMKGKLRYMPPEQILGELVDRRTDIFAVGVMVWEAVANQKMWRGMTDATIMHNVINGRIPSPRTVKEDVPERLERICMKALAAAQADRYATAAELQSELEECLAGETVSNRSIGQFVNSLFADVRAKTHEIIEHQLAEVAREPNPGGANLIGRQMPSIELTSPTMTESNSSRQGPTPSGPRRSRWMLGMALFFGIAAAGITVRIFGRTPPRDSSSNDRVLTPSETSAPRAVEPPEIAVSDSGITEVALSLSASPPKAKLYLDDRPLPSNPYSGSVPSDAIPHSIRAEAAGYRSEEKSLLFKNDTEVTLTLEPAKDRARAQTPPRPVSSRGPAVLTSPPPKVNCNPPYMIDETGIQRLKPECISPGEK
jgi:eukaryotic-like serine/threonine-protein kinase